MRSEAFLCSLLLTVAMAAHGTEMQDLSVQTPHGIFKFKVEIATTDQERERGLMFRRWLDPNGGMLFLFEQEQPVAMWMKNTFIPLDMLFVRKDGCIANIREHAVPQSLDIIASGKPVSAVVELSDGTVSRLQVNIGDRVVSAGVGKAAQPVDRPGRHVPDTVCSIVQSRLG